MYRFLDPKNDFAFKRVFGTEKNKEILINFLNDVLEGQHEKIEDVEFLKTNQDPEIALLRQSIVDVLCRDMKGNSLIVEMQYAGDSHFIKRAVAYACRAYLDQRKKRDDKTKSQGYEDMRRVIFFAILEKPLFNGKREYLSHHKVTDVCTGENDIKELSFSFLELSKFEKNSINQLKTNIEKWAYFFKYAESVNPDEIKTLEERDARFWKAYTALAEYNYTPEELLDYERYAMKQDEIATSLSDAEKRGEKKGIAIGKEEGIAEGELRGKRETALNAIAMGLSKEQIAKLTGLSVKEIESLNNKQ